MYIAEYLGQRTEFSQSITPIKGNSDLCPFNGFPCRKITSADRKAPICSLRRNEELYIVCEERLISTKIEKITSYQQEKLLEVSQYIYNPYIQPVDIGIKSEVSIKIPNKRGAYKADFVIKLLNNTIETLSPRGAIMEVQGGGETSNTGNMQRHITNWENGNLSHSQLTDNLPNVGPIQNNAWKRLQDQIFIKTAIAKHQGYGFIACIGSLLYEQINFKLQNIKNLQNQKWELAFITFIEDKSKPITPGAIPLKIEPEKTLFTTFDEFVFAIQNQGVLVPNIFTGIFYDLLGNQIIVS